MDFDEWILPPLRCGGSPRPMKPQAQGSKDVRETGLPEIRNPRKRLGEEPGHRPRAGHCTKKIKL